MFTNKMSEKGSIVELLAVVLFVLVGFVILYVAILSHAQGGIMNVINALNTLP